MKIIKERQDNGYILATVLLMLLVLTVIGVAALRTSSLENTLAGNIRQDITCKEIADSGLKPVSGAIDTLVSDSDPGVYAPYVPAGTNSSLGLELRSNLLPPNSTGTSIDSGDAAADFAFSVGAVNVLIDIDKTGSDSAGQGLENHNCYEGVGKCSGSKRFYYRINSECNDPAIGTRSIAGSLYMYVPK